MFIPCNLQSIDLHSIGTKPRLTLTLVLKIAQFMYFTPPCHYSEDSGTVGQAGCTDELVCRWNRNLYTYPKRRRIEMINHEAETPVTVVTRT